MVEDGFGVVLSASNDGGGCEPDVAGGDGDVTRSIFADSACAS